MRIFLAPVFAILLYFAGTALAASGPTEFTGTPAVLPSGIIMIDGHDVTLWGIDQLASDQECWHESRTWDCGEQALIALRHHLAGHRARCIVKSDTSNPIGAQCFCKTGDKEDDIARFLVMQGWARDEHDVTNGLYADDEKAARQSRHGIWTSRFQTAEDWKNGVLRYVEYQSAEPTPRATPAASAK
jgi:endonuclease YncB( thermonuclease family)